MILLEHLHAENDKQLTKLTSSFLQKIPPVNPALKLPKYFEVGKIQRQPSASSFVNI